MNKSLVVLGGAGFLGQAIITSLLENGCKDIASADLEMAETNKAVENITVDVLNKKELYAKCHRFSTVINCTGQITNPVNQCLMLNSMGIFNIAELCANTNKKLVHISTVAVYGTVEKADENTPINPETVYGTCKYYSELLLRETISLSKCIILRLANLYGKGQAKGLIPYLANSISSDSEFKFDNNGDLLRYFIDVRDCANNIVKIISKNVESGVFNMAGKERYSIKELIALLEKLTGATVKVKYDQALPRDNIGRISDDKIHAKIQAEFKYNLRDFFSEMLCKTSLLSGVRE